MSHASPETRRRKLVIALAAALAAIVVPLYAIKVHHKNDYTDFDVYYRAAVRAKGQAFSEIYTLKDGASPFRYAPPVIPFLRPLAELPRTEARLSWYFLQLAFFAAGFAFLFRALSLLKPAHGAAGSGGAHGAADSGGALGAPSSGGALGSGGTPRAGRGSQARFETALAFLFILRLCLDTFTIGQVSSLLFLGFCAGLYGFMRRRPWLAGTALFPSALLKIGPGFVYTVFLAARGRDRLKAWAAPLGLLLAVSAVFWIYSLATGWNVREAWSAWATIVANDSVYYDASHYGSQSLKSFLLRLAKTGAIGPAAAETLWALIGVAVCSGLFALWTLRRPRTFYGRGLFYSAALFPYFWLMPETFKYSLTGLAIPAAMLTHGLSRRWSRLSAFALAFLAAAVSLPGKDLVGDTLFFGIQRLSLPFFATIALAAAILAECLRESEVSRAGRGLVALVRFRKVGPWEREPRALAEADLEYSILAPLALSAHDSISSGNFANSLRELETFMKSRPGGELLVIPWGDRLSDWHPTLRLARESLRALPPDHARVTDAPEVSGPGAALRAGFLQSRGRKILFCNLAQPCEPSFYARALERLDAGAAIVRGNRRLPESRFRVPVRLLAFVYGRHRLGLGFNLLVRALLPVRTTDTQSGIAALSREFALEAFRLQCSPEFLLELELSLIARLHGAREEELPVRLFLSQEKSKSRMLHETLVILFSLPRLARRVARGYYSPAHTPSVIPSAVTADDWGMSPAVNAGILALARRGVVRRTSVMARSRHIDSGLEELKAIPGIELGLHFDLTFGTEAPGTVLKRWVLSGLAGPGIRRRLISDVRRELKAQLETLARHGIRPTYLDGHHHIHLVPGILEAIAPLVREAGIRQVRLPLDQDLGLGLLATGKAPLLALSAWARRSVRRQGFESLPCFYPALKHYSDYALMRRALQARPGHEIITHPATEDDLERHRVPDTYGAGRVIEFRALRMLAPLAPERLT